MGQILSFNSQLAYGHVGGEAVRFCLRRLGHEVWQVPTVQYSNHPGHGGFLGGAVPLSRMSELLNGMSERGLLDDCVAIHSGFLGSGAVAALILSIRQQLPEAVFLCDPIMGDHGDSGGQTYVSDDVVAALGEELVPVADIITPNRYELSLLSGLPCDNLDQVIIAAKKLLAGGVGLVVCTSAEIDEQWVTTLAVTEGRRHIVRTPKLRNAPHGAGDAFSAIFLARMLDLGDVGQALSHAAGALHGLLSAGTHGMEHELALVSAQDEIVSPSLSPTVETYDG